MKTHSRKNRLRALTLIEVLVVIIMVAVLLGMLLPGSKAPGRAQRIACVNNLKQVGLAFHLWANDHEEMFPLQVSTNTGGTREFLKGPNVFLHFQIMTNELVTPKILFCPAESDSTRCMADTFSKPVSNRDKWRIPFTGNTNVSYFVGVDSVTTNGEMFLSGDHNITNGTPIKNGLLELTTNRPSGWTDENHHKQGNVGLTDGSVQQFSNTTVREALRHSNVETNRIAMP